MYCVPVNRSLNARRQSPLTGRRDSRGRWRCYTRVQENALGGRLRVGRFRSWNRGERGILLNQSNQSDSGAPSTVMGQSQLRNGESGTWTWGSSKDGSVSRSVSVFVLRGRPGRSRGLGRLTPKMGAGDHPGQDAKPAPHRLLLVGGVCWRSPPRRSPAIGRWVLSVGASHPVPSASESFPSQGVVHDGPGVRRPV